MISPFILISAEEVCFSNLVCLSVGSKSRECILMIAKHRYQLNLLGR